MFRSVITSYNSAEEQERTEEDISCSSPKVINYLSLADGENYSKNLIQNISKRYKEDEQTNINTFAHMP